MHLHLEVTANTFSCSAGHWSHPRHNNTCGKTIQHKGENKIVCCWPLTVWIQSPAFAFVCSPLLCCCMFTWMQMLFRSFNVEDWKKWGQMLCRLSAYMVSRSNWWMEISLNLKMKIFVRRMSIQSPHGGQWTLALRLIVIKHIWHFDKTSENCLVDKWKKSKKWKECHSVLCWVPYVTQYSAFHGIPEKKCRNNKANRVQRSQFIRE